MSISNSVYELLCLYEGPSPREHFKPHLQPSDWRQREKTQSHFRSQVPDPLENAYDIALGEGLIKAHLLWREDVPESYKSLGLPSPDALIEMTDKGRAALADYRDQPPKGEWSVAKSPGEWQKELGIHESMWRRYVKSNILVTDPLTRKNVRIRLDTLNALKRDK